MAAYTFNVTDDAPEELNSIDTALGTYEVSGGKVTTDSTVEASLLADVPYLEAADGDHSEAEDPAVVQQRAFDEAHPEVAEAPEVVETHSVFDDLDITETPEVDN